MSAELLRKAAFNLTRGPSVVITDGRGQTDIAGTLADALDDHAEIHSAYECGWKACALVDLARLIVGERS